MDKVLFKQLMHPSLRNLMYWAVTSSPRSRRTLPMFSGSQGDGMVKMEDRISGNWFEKQEDFSRLRRLTSLEYLDDATPRLAGIASKWSDHWIPYWWWLMSSLDAEDINKIILAATIGLQCAVWCIKNSSHCTLLLVKDHLEIVSCVENLPKWWTSLMKIKLKKCL